MPARVEEIAAILRQQIEQFDTSVASTSVGTVIEASDGDFRGAVTGRPRRLCRCTPRRNYRRTKEHVTSA